MSAMLCTDSPVLPSAASLRDSPAPTFDSLPLDIVQLVVDHLVVQASAETGKQVVVAVDALAASSKLLHGVATREAVSARLMSRLGVAAHDYICHGESMVLVRAICRADRMLRERAQCRVPVGSTHLLHVCLAPRGNGWLQSLMALLGPLGLATAVTDQHCNPAPFAFVWCDARPPPPLPQEAPDASLLAAPSRPFATHPCAWHRCLQPATSGCLHCAKHGGREAAAIIGRYVGGGAACDGGDGGGDGGGACGVARVAPSVALQRVVLLAPSAAVQEAFKRAAHMASRQLGGSACRSASPAPMPVHSPTPAATAAAPTLTSVPRDEGCAEHSAVTLSGGGGCGSELVRAAACERETEKRVRVDCTLR